MCPFPSYRVKINNFWGVIVTPGHALQVGVQRKLTSNLPACREAGVECIPIVAETLGGLAEDAIFTVRSHHQTYFPEVRHCPLAGQRVPLAPSPSNPPILSGWCRLTLPFHLCHASHAFVFISVFEIVHVYALLLYAHAHA